MSLFSTGKSKPVARDSKSGEFSVFIREADSREKKRVYNRVLKDSIAVQDRLIKSARAAQVQSKRK